MQERGGGGHGGFDVGDLVAVDGVHDRGQDEASGVAGGEAGVAVGGPLHGGADGVAVAEPDVVAHADLVAVVEDRRAGEGQQEGGEEFDLVAVVVEEGGQTASDADVGAHAGVFGVFGPHVVAFFVGDHFEGELVVVAQEDAPLAVVGDGGGLGEDFGDRVARFAPDCHEDAGHDGEVECHVAFVAAAGEVAEVVDDVFGPLVGFCEEDGVGVVVVDFFADVFEELVGGGEVFAVGAFGLVEVGDGVEAEAVDAEVEPEFEGGEDFFLDCGVFVVEVGLVGEEAVPVVLFADGVEGPVGGFGVDEDDAGFWVLFVFVGPDVVVAVGALGVVS
ncbi:hypothetical protein T45_09355 [Streptomyces turgidiscabies]|nr:hypothetical protein T45_09355 [Streptomyces turgidiscabies]